MRRFKLVRDTDVTGISGTGEVCLGVEIDAEHGGGVYIFWRGGLESATTTRHPSIENVMRIHCHNGSSHVEWIDTE